MYVMVIARREGAVNRHPCVAPCIVLPLEGCVGAVKSAVGNSIEIEQAFSDVFDQALLFHSFTDYMRDYEMVFAAAAPSTGIPPEHLRYRFRNCVFAETSSTVRPEVWNRSLDDALIDFESGVDVDGFAWGIGWQNMYPGARLVDESRRAGEWATRLGLGFHEAQIATEAHLVTLVCSDLEVATIDAGFTPFRVTER